MVKKSEATLITLNFNLIKVKNQTRKNGFKVNPLNWDNFKTF